VISVVIAAHNEASVITSCLDTLLADARAGEFDVIVVANGCSDDTAAVAAVNSQVTVLDLARAGKSAALNAGDAIARGFPRIYLDADIRLSTSAARALSVAVEPEPATPGPTGVRHVLAAVPRRTLQLDGRPLLVKSYFAINRELPLFTHGLFGRGAIALSAAGRKRFDQFPDLVADDLFLDSLFSDDEKAQIDSISVEVATPRRTRDLLRRLVRVRRGNAAMRKAAGTPAVSGSVRPAARWSWLKDVVAKKPLLAPHAVVYLLITVVAAIRARRAPSTTDPWGTDQSTRV
jgi:glycosyltransferase involved in cell wall biosynthesis